MTGVPEDSGMARVAFQNSKQRRQQRMSTVLENRPVTWKNKDCGSSAPWLKLWPPPTKIYWSPTPWYPCKCPYLETGLCRCKQDEVIRVGPNPTWLDDDTRKNAPWRWWQTGRTPCDDTGRQMQAEVTPRSWEEATKAVSPTGFRQSTRFVVFCYSNSRRWSQLVISK